MASSMSGALRKAEGNPLAPALPLVGAVPDQRRAAAAEAVGGDWLLRIVAESIDACMSRKEAAIRAGVSESVFSRQVAGADGKCLNFEKFGLLGDAVAIELADRIRAHFNLDDPAVRLQHAMNLITQGMGLLVAEVRR